MRPRTGWRTCWPLTGRARGSVWRCCCSGPPRRSWRCWRCSRPGRPICRSTRRCPAARIGFMLADAAPIAAITTAGLADRLDGCDVAVIEVDDPAIDSPTQHRLAGAGARGHRLPDLHLGHHRCPQGGGHHPPQPDPAVAAVEPTGAAARRRCGRSVIRWPSTSRCGRSGVRCWVVGGWWWCPSRWPVPPMISTPCWSAEQVNVLEPDPVGVVARAVRRRGWSRRRCCSAVRPDRPRWWIGGRRGGW